MDSVYLTHHGICGAAVMSRKIIDRDRVRRESLMEMSTFSYKTFFETPNFAPVQEPSVLQLHHRRTLLQTIFSASHPGDMGPRRLRSASPQPIQVNTTGKPNEYLCMVYSARVMLSLIQKYQARCSSAKSNAKSNACYDIPMIRFLPNIM